ncbi:MAG: hypothetical protein IOC86_04440 [Aestuariivirga sp.]|nr:hypothetical protein [Acidobacteriaceae bacterium]MCA3573141.1 hypothetical protein [Aestuariivirga sp.]
MTVTPYYMFLDGQKVTALDNNDGTKTLSVSGGQDLWRTTFARVLASGVDPTWFRQIGPIGTGHTISQSGGNLNIASGTTANSEVIIRSVVSWMDSATLRWQSILSQRIANNNFVVELVDVVGDNLAYTINSATSVTVTFPNNTNPFNSTNVGQSVSMGAITGAAGIPGRYVIASATPNSVTFTVAGWPVSGSGTLSLYGWNFARCNYTGTVATNVNYDTGRRGWASGDTVATINTTASPGHMGIVTLEDGMSSLLDQLVASSTTVATTARASRVVNLPEESTPLFLQIRSTNGSVAPASSTTWTLGMVSLTKYGAVNVAVNSVRPQPFNSTMPVTLQGTSTVTFTQPALVASTALIGDVGVQYRATASGSSATHLVSAATTNPTLVKAAAGKVLGWSFSNTTAAWVYVKLHNQATAPTAGTGVVRTIGIPPNGVNTFYSEGGAFTFTTGIGLTTVTGAADADATAVGLNAIVGELVWV